MLAIASNLFLEFLCSFAYKSAKIYTQFRFTIVVVLDGYSLLAVAVVIELLVRVNVLIEVRPLRVVVVVRFRSMEQLVGAALAGAW